MFLTWGSSSTIVGLSKVVDEVFNSISTEGWYKVIHSMQDVVLGLRSYKPNPLLSLDVTALPNDLSDRTFAAIGMRAKQEEAERLFIKYLSDYQGSDPNVLKFCQELVLNLALANPDYWQQALKVVAENYAEGFIFDANAFYSRIRNDNANTLPIRVAEEITDHPEKYPRFLVTFAESKCREAVASKIIPVGKIAQEDRWGRAVASLGRQRGHGEAWMEAPQASCPPWSPRLNNSNA